MAPQRNHKGQPGPKPTKPPKYECSVCRKELAGDLARHALIHAEPSVKYRFFCPHDGCDRANKPGNKGFPQKCNMLTHLKAVHARTKHRCPHTYICQGFITECGSLLSDASALSRHRKNFHNYEAGDSPAKVAVPTPCTADHSRTAQCGKYTDRARHTRKRPVEKAFDDRADYLGVAPVAGPSTWSNIKPEPVDFGLLLPSTRTYGVSSAQTTDDVDAVLNQFLSANGLVSSTTASSQNPPSASSSRIRCSGPAMICSRTSGPCRHPTSTTPARRRASRRCTRAIPRRTSTASR
ncbi:hypothetical protein C8T65DRAFT_297732 [Cerioporus squamosus]|nr:hypothetical protein C8T65DRAFT_297732 [Cerioporus squamosus]